MKRNVFLLVIAIVAIAAFPAFAQEHPEHPDNHKALTKAITIDDLEKEIKAQVDKKTTENNGWFPLKDDKTGDMWSLKLDKVHRERLARLDENTYFACTDFNAKDGRKVDVDFFLKNEDGKLVMNDMTVHKIDGKARYDWQEEKGFWKKVEVAKQQ